MEDETDAALLQNLRDAGCGEALARQCAALSKSGRNRELMRLLAGRRSELLDAVHCEQDRLDCLDYLIHRMRKNNE